MQASKPAHNGRGKHDKHMKNPQVVLFAAAFDRLVTQLESLPNSGPHSLERVTIWSGHGKDGPTAFATATLKTKLHSSVSHDEIYGVNESKTH